jgi:hypothetical protein
VVDRSNFLVWAHAGTDGHAGRCNATLVCGSAAVPSAGLVRGLGVVSAGREAGGRLFILLPSLQVIFFFEVGLFVLAWSGFEAGKNLKLILRYIFVRSLRILNHHTNSWGTFNENTRRGLGPPTTQLTLFALLLSLSLTSHPALTTLNHPPIVPLTHYTATQTIS